MTQRYALKLGLKVYQTNFEAYKIVDFISKIFEMVLISFQVKNKLQKARFIHKMFLLAHISVKIILEKFFLNFNNANIQFLKKELT